MTYRKKGRAICWNLSDMKAGERGFVRSAPFGCTMESFDEVEFVGSNINSVTIKLRGGTLRVPREKVKGIIICGTREGVMAYEWTWR